MVNKYPESIDSPAEYSDWVARLADSVIDSLETENSEPLSELSKTRIESAVEQEVDEKIDSLCESQTPKDILRFSEKLPGDLIQGRMRTAANIDEEADEMARFALRKSIVEEVQFEIERISDQNR